LCIASFDRINEKLNEKEIVSDKKIKANLFFSFTSDILSTGPCFAFNVFRNVCSTSNSSSKKMNYTLKNNIN
jgi:hypothetical protein